MEKLMEKLNLKFDNSFNIVKSTLWILSILSWLFFLCTGWASIYYIGHYGKNNYYIFWTIKIISEKLQRKYYKMKEI